MIKKKEPQLLNKNSHRESLLKPQFRKPSTQTSALVAKKRSTHVVAETSRSVAGKNGDKQKVQTITHSRMNLLRALSNVKNGNDNKPEFFRGDFDDNAQYMRSDEDCSEKSSSNDGVETSITDSLKTSSRKRLSPNGVHSEDSSDSDYMKKYPNLPIEPPPKIDYNQEEFLSIFKLITPQVFESLKLRRSERKRRNCTKNEKNDFHYGNFDLNEVRRAERRLESVLRS